MDKKNLENQKKLLTNSPKYAILIMSKGTRQDQVAQKECKKLKLKAKERLTALQEELAALDKA